MSKSKITPIQTDVWPCPPSAPDALYAAPEFNQGTVKLELERVFRATKKVSNNSTGVPDQTVSGAMQVAIDPLLPLEIELAMDPTTATSWAGDYGNFPNWDFIIPQGRKGGVQLVGSTDSMIWRGFLGYNVFQLTGPGERSLIARIYVSTAGNIFKFNHVSVNFGVSTSNFVVNGTKQITGIEPVALKSSVAAGQYNSPGSFTLGNGNLVYMYLTISDVQNGVGQLAFSSQSVV